MINARRNGEPDGQTGESGEKRAKKRENGTGGAEMARNETKQQTSVLAERNYTTAKFNILHTTDKRGIERNKVTRKQKGRKRKMKPDNLRKTDGSEKLEEWGERNV